MKSKMTSALKFSLLFVMGLVLLVHFFLESSTRHVQADTKLYQLMKLQRQIDRYLPLSQGHLQGTHNSYNSDAYHNLLRYHDRQQVMSIGEQLQYGARFIELDVHWTFSFHKLTSDFLLCHGSSKLTLLPFHLGCSPFDLPLEEALREVSEWLNDDANQDEVLIFYIEDHTDGQHQRLYQLLERYDISQAMYPSGACHEIPEALTKHDVLQAGKQLVFWKDELRDGWGKLPCSDYAPLVNLAYSSLGALDRQAEDRTFIGTYTKRLDQGYYPRIEYSDIETKMLEGGNIINLDNFSVNDSRQYALLWTWGIDVELPDAQACTVMRATGKWDFVACDSKPRQAACRDPTTQAWTLTEQVLSFDEARSACHNESVGRFSAPANYLENRQVFKALQAGQSEAIWLNIVYKPSVIVVGDTRTSHHEQIE